MGKEKYLQPNYSYERCLGDDISTTKGAICQELCNESNVLAVLVNLFGHNKELVEIIDGEIGQEEENVPNKWKISICKTKLA